MDTPDTARDGQDTKVVGSLYVAFKLGDRNWRLSLGDGVRAPSRCTVTAGDTAAVFTAIAKAKARCHLAADTPVRSCYEAGRDGFWLHRCLEEHQIANLVVDSASIEVNRCRRRAKTDSLDSDKLLSILMRYYGGERRAVRAVARTSPPNRKMSGGCTGNSVACGRSSPRTATGSARCWYSTICGSTSSVAARGHTGGRSTPRDCYQACAPRSSASSSGCRSLSGSSGRLRRAAA
jgi:hypothetical protein